MKPNLLIVGAGVYGMIAKEIAEEMQLFDRIDFVDDHVEIAFDGSPVVGGVPDLKELSNRYSQIIVAIGNAAVRSKILDEIKAMGRFCVATLISPRAHVSSSARVAQGCVIEPMAVVHVGAVLFEGCIVSAGAVVNHAAVCERCVHVDCNAVVRGGTVVPQATKVFSCECYE